MHGDGRARVRAGLVVESEVAETFGPEQALQARQLVLPRRLPRGLVELLRLRVYRARCA